MVAAVADPFTWSVVTKGQSARRTGVEGGGARGKSTVQGNTMKTVSRSCWNTTKVAHVE